MNTRRLLSLSLLLTSCATASSTGDTTPRPAPSEAPLQEPAPSAQPNKTCAELFDAKDYGSLHKRMAPHVASLINVQQLKELGQAMEQQAGKKLETLAEHRVPTLRGESYHRVATYEKEPKPVEIQCEVDTEGTIYSFVVRPEPQPAPTTKLDYQTKTPLRLPFTGTWYVYWGGPTVRQNYHAVVPDQRFALDLLIERDGKTFLRDGTQNEDYYCWGEVITAPGPGNVIKVVNSVPDNPPGTMNPKQPAGNYIIIDHENGEYSLLAHLIKGTIEVKKGQWVTPGVVIGRCGNSGNSSEPHLHYHLQDGPQFGKGQGLPIQFLDAQLDGADKARTDVRRGQHVGTPPRLTDLSMWGIKFENAGLRDVLAPYEKSILKRPIAIDPKVASLAEKVRFTFAAESKVPSPEALKLLSQALREAGLELRKKGVGFIVTSPWHPAE